MWSLLDSLRKDLDTAEAEQLEAYKLLSRAQKLVISRNGKVHALRIAVETLETELDKEHAKRS